MRGWNVIRLEMVTFFVRNLTKNGRVSWISCAKYKPKEGFSELPHITTYRPTPYSKKIFRGTKEGFVKFLTSMRDLV